MSGVFDNTKVDPLMKDWDAFNPALTPSDPDLTIPFRAFQAMTKEQRDDWVKRMKAVAERLKRAEEKAWKYDGCSK